MITFQTAYAYPTSIWAKRLNREECGCYLVQRTVGHNPPLLDMGPFETKAQAQAWARLFQSVLGEA